METLTLTFRETMTRFLHLCACGTPIIERREIIAGRWASRFEDAAGTGLTDCPGCGCKLAEMWGPSEAEREREESLPPYMLARKDDDDDLFR